MEQRFLAWLVVFSAGVAVFPHLAASQERGRGGAASRLETERRLRGSLFDAEASIAGQVAVIDASRSRISDLKESLFIIPRHWSYSSIGEYSFKQLFDGKPDLTGFHRVFIGVSDRAKRSAYSLERKRGATKVPWEVGSNLPFTEEDQKLFFSRNETYKPGMVYDSKGHYHFEVLATFGPYLLYEGWYAEGGKTVQVEPAVTFGDWFEPMLRDFRRQLGVGEFNIPKNMLAVPWHGAWPLNSDFGLRVKEGKPSFFPIVRFQDKEEGVKPIFVNTAYTPSLPSFGEQAVKEGFFVNGVLFKETNEEYEWHFGAFGIGREQHYDYSEIFEERVYFFDQKRRNVAVGVFKKHR